MGNFAIGSLRGETTHQLNNGGEIVVLNELLVGEQEALVEKQKPGVSHFSLMLEMLVVYIRKWNFVESEGGEVLPVSVETLRKLPDSLLTEIMEKVTWKTKEQLQEIAKQGGNIFSKKEDKKKD